MGLGRGRAPEGIEMEIPIYGQIIIGAALVVIAIEFITVFQRKREAEIMNRLQRMGNNHE